MRREKAGFIAAFGEHRLCISPTGPGTIQLRSARPPRAARPPTRVIITRGTLMASIRGLHRARHRAKHLEVMTELYPPSPLECSELHEQSGLSSLGPECRSVSAHSSALCENRAPRGGLSLQRKQLVLGPLYVGGSAAYENPAQSHRVWGATGMYFK